MHRYAVPTKTTVARGLEGREAQTLTDFLDGVSMLPTTHASMTSEDKSQTQVLAGPCLESTKLCVLASSCTCLGLLAGADQ